MSISIIPSLRHLCVAVDPAPLFLPTRLGIQMPSPVFIHIATFLTFRNRFVNPFLHPQFPRTNQHLTFAITDPPKITDSVANRTNQGPKISLGECIWITEGTGKGVSNQQNTVPKHTSKEVFPWDLCSPTGGGTWKELR